jgi:hypothetical protein
MPEIITEPTVCPVCGSDDLGVFAATEQREDEADLVTCEDCHWGAALTAEGAANMVEAEQRRLGPGAEFIGASDGIVLLATREHGILVDVQGEEACVRLLDGSLTYTGMANLAHPDSPAATD